MGSFPSIYLEQLIKFSSRCDIKFQPIWIYHCAPECLPWGTFRRATSGARTRVRYLLLSQLPIICWVGFDHLCSMECDIQLRFVVGDVTAGAAARFHRSYFDHWRSKKWSKESIRVSEPNKGWSTDVTVAAHRGCARLKFRSNLNSKVSRTPSLLSSL